MNKPSEYAYNYQELRTTLGWEPITIEEAETSWRQRYRDAVKASGMAYLDDDLVWATWRADLIYHDTCFMDGNPQEENRHRRDPSSLNKLYEVIGDMISQHLGLAVGEESPATTVFIRKGKLCALAERIYIEIVAEYLPEPDIYGLEVEEDAPQ